MEASKSTKKLPANKKQNRLIEKLRHQSAVLRGITVSSAVVIVLLLLLLGFATDWTRGLHKDKTATTTTPLSSNLDSLRTSPTGNSTDNTSSDTDGTTNTNGRTNSNTTSRETSSNTSNTTTNNSTTTNNNTTTDPQQPSSGLLSLYADSNVGDDVTDILTQAQLLGISPTCHNDVLIQVCDFTVDGNTITTKNLLGTGLITSILKNF